jgi:hypothetical protein
MASVMNPSLIRLTYTRAYQAERIARRRRFSHS